MPYPAQVIIFLEGKMQPSPHTTRDIWQHYVSTRSLPHSVLREPIFRAWQRCDQAGASPLVARAYELPELQARSLFEQESDLIQAARPYMRALSQAAGSDRHAAMLGDRDSTVLDVVGDEESVHGRQRVPGPGALLSEARAGANGIGSPLAEGGYIELVGPEHFIEGFHRFTCQGLPLYGPDGETIGVLSTSVRRVEASRRIHEILICAARGIEAELMRRRLSADVQNLVVSRSGGPLLEKLEQDIVQLQGAARLRLERAVRLVTGDRRPDAMRLIATANDLIARFHRQSQLWREIGSATTTPPRFLDFDQEVADMAALLSTEAAVRGLEVEIHTLSPGMRVFADVSVLRRALFRTFLLAFEKAPPRSTLQIQVLEDKRTEVGLVRFPRVPEAVLAIPRHSRATGKQIEHLLGNEGSK